MMKVTLINITPDAEQQIVYIARVSNPNNQDNPEYSRLLNYCIRHQHWSIFEHSHMTVEIETSRAISTQLLRHRSFCFQEFSQRYADSVQLMGFEPIEWRRQAEKNRQSSTELVDQTLINELDEVWINILEDITRLYEYAVENGVAKECARFVLPQCTMTRLYMTGNIRSWIHYLQLRTQENVQLEHRQVALAIQKIFVEQLPVISQALGWIEGDETYVTQS